MSTVDAAALSRGYSQMDAEKPPRAYKDVEWAIAWLLHIVAVVAIGGLYMPELIGDVQSGVAEPGGDTSAPDIKVDPEVRRAVGHALKLSAPFIGIGVGVSLGWAMVWMTLVKAYARQLIYIALLAPPILFGFMTMTSILAGAAGGAIPLALLTGILAYYAYFILHQPGRVEFATLCLTMIITVVRKYPGTLVTAFVSIIPATLFQLGWLAVVSGASWHFYKLGETYSVVDENGVQQELRSFPAAGKAVLVFLLLSNYWTAQVVTNVVHVANSGVVATWYFMGNNMPASPSVGALKRACTTSFGSICLGSLLVAIVQVLREIINQSRRQSDNAFAALIMCCISCLLGYIEALMELFNHWAFVQVAIYGKDFKTAAKDTMQLVKSRGLSGLVNMNLTGSAVGLGAIVGMCLSGLVVGLVAYHPMVAVPTKAVGLSDAANQVYVTAYTVVVCIAVLLAGVFAAMVSSTITTGTTTLFVCFAEDPAALQATNPELHARFEQITSEFLVEHPYDGPPVGMTGGASGAPTAQHMYEGPQPGHRQLPHAYAVPAHGSNNA